MAEPRHRRLARGVALTAAALLLLALLSGLVFHLLDRLYPPDLSRLRTLSTEVVDGQGRTLRAYLAADGAYRLPTAAADVDPRYLRMLIAFEDKRFRAHPGIDPLALARAVGQAAANGRIVSGASTLTMQAARLLEPRPRTLAAKLIEMFRALQLERHFSKDEILGIYLTLAPFGGNLEGARAAVESYFGKPPKLLSAAEAAVLVALPKAPSLVRPDRYPARAAGARDKVLQRVGAASGYDARALALAAREPVPARLRPLPLRAPHLADRLRNAAPQARRIETAIDGALQAQLEARAARWTRDLAPRVSLAVLVVENAGRAVRAYLGSADFLDRAAAGQVDAVTAPRSPGSTLKPLVYGLAFDRGLAHPATRILDAPRQFGDYAPANFMSAYYGEVTLAEALRLSLNVPAVAVLERLGPVAFTERLRRDGIRLEFAEPESPPGLALALGGVGTTLEDLVRLYAALADDGRALPLRYLRGAPAVRTQALLRPRARWQVAEILRQLPPPDGQLARAASAAPGIAFKTGTSYGFRDAWAIGFTPRHTVGVWVGRPDGAPHPGHFGANTAAPLLFEIFELLPAGGEDAPPPAGLVASAEALPPVLRRLDETEAGSGAAGAAPRIAFPPDRAVLRWRPGGLPLTLEAEGGRRPLAWLIDGRPLPAAEHARVARWTPDGPGFSEIVVVDAEGRRAAAQVRLVAEALPQAARLRPD